MAGPPYRALIDRLNGLGLPFEFCLLAGAVVAGAFGLLVGLPALRMRGLYLALITLMVAAAYSGLWPPAASCRVARTSGRARWSRPISS